MISNRCARKSLVTNCNSIISKNYFRFLVDSNEKIYKKGIYHHDISLPKLKLNLNLFFKFTLEYLRSSDSD